MKRFLLIFLVVLVVGGIGIPITAAPSRMGYVRLKNGNIIYGEILKNDSEEVELRYKFGRLKINKVFVKSVEKESERKGGGPIHTVGTYTGPTISPSPGGKLPAKPTNPTPADGATGVALDKKLSWRGVSGATGYIVRFADIGVLLDGSDAANPSQSGTAFDPGKLKINTHYHWRIDWIDSDGAVTSGPVWTFTTVKKPPKVVRPEEELLGEPKTILGMRFTIRGPRNWVEETMDIGNSSAGEPRQILVFTGSSEKGDTRRIIVGRMRNVPKTGEERKEFILNLLRDYDPIYYISHGEGEFEAPTFSGETLYIKGSIDKKMFRCNFYFGKEYTYILSFFASSDEFESLSKLFNLVAKSFTIH
ncbi:MAG: hypothetical protein E3J72_01830 [Planctomycetota bacterium]|nr:MAG: hypothetical protein E3J72_01830 [Planctomycetota bacterium]